MQSNFLDFSLLSKTSQFVLLSSTISIFELVILSLIIISLSIFPSELNTLSAPVEMSSSCFAAEKPCLKNSTKFDITDSTSFAN